VPGEGSTQRDVALYVLDLEAAYQDCRARLVTVGRLVSE
jgi:hypothetical protein